MGTAAATRKIGRSSTSAAIPEELKNSAKEVFKLNKQMNEATRAHDKARRDLYAQQKESGITSFTCDAIIDGKKITLDSTISTPQRLVVDVAVLRRLVDEETFMKCVSATQKSVVDEAGKAIFDRCSNSVEGTEAVSVKAAK
jgi:hypothetical protein